MKGKLTDDIIVEYINYVFQVHEYQNNDKIY